MRWRGARVATVPVLRSLRFTFRSYLYCSGALGLALALHAHYPNVLLFFISLVPAIVTIFVHPRPSSVARAFVLILQIVLASLLLGVAIHAGCFFVHGMEDQGDANSFSRTCCATLNIYFPLFDTLFGRPGGDAYLHYLNWWFVTGESFRK